jgi:hypothetical protein
MYQSWLSCGQHFGESSPAPLASFRKCTRLGCRFARRFRAGVGAFCFVTERARGLGVALEKRIRAVASVLFQFLWCGVLFVEWQSAGGRERCTGMRNWSARAWRVVGKSGV